jgi:hypothetical protein
MRGKGGALAGALAFVAACTSFTSSTEDDLSSSRGADAGGDAGANVDAAGAHADVPADAAPDGGPVTLFAEGFEQMTGCGALSGSGITLERVTTASASGSASCKICLTAGGVRTAMVKVAHARAGRYRFEARVHDTADGGTWFASLDFTAGGSDTNDGITNTGALPSTWALAQVIREPTKPHDAVVGSIGGEGDTGYCFYVDDLSLVYEPAN